MTAVGGSLGGGGFEQKGKRLMDAEKSVVTAGARCVKVASMVMGKYTTKSEWLLIKLQTSVCKDADKKEPSSCLVGGISIGACHGKQYEVLKKLKNRTTV